MRAVQLACNCTTLSLLQTKLAEKKQTNIYALYSSVSDFKSFLALSSRKGGTIPLSPPLCTPLFKTEIQGYLQRMRSLVRPITGVQWSEFISIQGRRLLCLCFDF